MTPPRNASDAPGTSVSAAATRPPVSDSAAATVSPVRVSSRLISVASSRAAGPATPSAMYLPSQEKIAGAHSPPGGTGVVPRGMPVPSHHEALVRAGRPDTVAIFAIRPVRTDIRGY